MEASRKPSICQKIHSNQVLKKGWGPSPLGLRERSSSLSCLPTDGSTAETLACFWQSEDSNSTPFPKPGFPRHMQEIRTDGSPPTARVPHGSGLLFPLGVAWGLSSPHMGVGQDSQTRGRGSKARRTGHVTSSREAVSISAARDWALVWVAKRFFAS